MRDYAVYTTAGAVLKNLISLEKIPKPGEPIDVPGWGTRTVKGGKKLSAKPGCAVIVESRVGDPQPAAAAA